MRYFVAKRGSTGVGASPTHYAFKFCFGSRNLAGAGRNRNYGNAGRCNAALAPSPGGRANWRNPSLNLNAFEGLFVEFAKYNLRVRTLSLRPWPPFCSSVVTAR